MKMIKDCNVYSTFVYIFYLDYCLHKLLCTELYFIRTISNNADFVFFDFYNTYDSVSIIFKSKN